MGRVKLARKVYVLCGENEGPESFIVFEFFPFQNPVGRIVLNGKLGPPRTSL